MVESNELQVSVPNLLLTCNGIEVPDSRKCRESVLGLGDFGSESQALGSVSLQGFGGLLMIGMYKRALGKGSRLHNVGEIEC